MEANLFKRIKLIRRGYIQEWMRYNCYHCDKVTECKSATTNKELNYVSKNDEVRAKFGKLLTSIANVNEHRIDALKKFNALENYNVASGILRYADDQEKNPLVVYISLNTDSSSNYDINNDGSRNVPWETADFNVMKTHNSNEFADRVEIYKNELRERIMNQNKVANGMNEHTSEESDESDSDGKELTPTSKNKIKIKNRSDKTQTSKKSSETEDTNIKNEILNESSTGPVDSLRIWKSYSKKATKKCKKACKAAYKATCKDFKCSKSMKKSFKKNCKRECQYKFD